jgi:hypothetical protein
VWVRGEKHETLEGTDYSGFPWSCLDDEVQRELDEAFEWLPVPAAVTLRLITVRLSCLPMPRRATRCCQCWLARRQAAGDMPAENEQIKRLGRRGVVGRRNLLDEVKRLRAEVERLARLAGHRDERTPETCKKPIACAGPNAGLEADIERVMSVNAGVREVPD